MTDSSYDIKNQIQQITGQHHNTPEDAGAEIDWNQNEKIAAFLRVPNVYTSAWLINSPTVMPIVTAIMAPPMSIPLPDPVRPPAWESPVYTHHSQLIERLCHD